MKGNVKRRGEEGYSGVMLLLTMALAFIVALLMTRSLQYLRLSLDFDRNMMAYYAAEGGMQKALAAAEAGTTGAFAGRLGKCLYESRVAQEGGRLRITSLGYYYPAETRNAAATVKNLRKGKGAYKNRITVTGRVTAGRFVIESWEKTP